MRNKLHVAVVLFVFSGFIACGGGGGSSSPTPSPTVTLTSLSVSPSNPSVTQGATQQFTATGTYSDGHSATLTTASWSSSATNIATINGSGLASAVAAGATTITATSGNISGSTTLTVTPPAATLTSIAVTPATPSIKVGATEQFTATGTYSDGSQKTLTSVAWSSSATNIATISSSGLASAVSAGMTTITATSGSTSGATTLTVTPTLVAMTIAPALHTTNAGMTVQYSALGTYSDGSTTDVTGTASWSSSATGVVTIVSNTGLATAVSGGSSATITATLSGVSASTTLYVSSVTITGLSISPASLSLPANTKQQLQALATFNDNSTRDVTTEVQWSSSDPNAATVTSSGRLAVGATGATITASAGAVTASLTVTISSTALNAILVNPFSSNLPSGVKAQFSAVGYFADGSTRYLTQVTWTSSAGNVATVANTGVVTTVAAGTASITASAGAISGSATVTVSNLSLTAITVTPASASLPIGFAQQFTATGTLSDNSTMRLPVADWSSSAGGVATVDSTGTASALSPGTATIAASIGTLSGGTILTVSSTTLKQLVIAPATPTLYIGQAANFTGTATFQDNSTLDVTNSILWNSFAPLSFIVDRTGHGQALAGGSAPITAVFGTLTSSNQVQVQSAALQTLTVQGPTTMASGSTPQQLTAVGTYAGTVGSFTVGAASWTSSTPTVVSVSATGVATARASGTATITATYGNITSGPFTITVN